ncbi:MAG: hypothetical protein HGA45_06720 [Chloroflexales bacterium]|nr:hypothetical protein [Chloroflexales bacterium]
MNTLIVLGLAAAVLFAAAGSLLPNRVQPPQIIYVQAPLTDQAGGAGCLPLIILAGVVLLAFTLR